MRNFLAHDKALLSNVVHLAIPIIVQQLVITFLNVVSVVMVGQLGETAVAALGLANQIFFLMVFVLFGVSSGSAIFVAQYWGQKDIKNIRRILGIGLTLNLMSSTLFTLAAVLMPEVLLGIYSTDPAVVTLGSSYLRVVAFSYIMTAITVSYSATLRSVEQVKMPMMVSIIAVGINAVLSYGLIFGLWGLPQLGVVGAAIATCLSRLVECVILLVFTYGYDLPVAASLAEMFSYDWAFFKKFFTTALPVIFNEMGWSFGITTYNIIYARIGTESIAAVNIAATLEQLAFVIFIGLADSFAIMIGNKIGANDEATAYDYASKLLVFGIAGAMLMGVIVYSSSNLILNLYNVSETAHQYARNIIIAFSLTMWVRVSNLNLCIGILRSGGDTRYAFIVDIGSIWLVGVPMAFTGAFILHLPVYWVYLMAISEEFVKFGLWLTRFFSKKWINNLVQQPALAAA